MVRSGSRTYRERNSPRRSLRRSRPLKREHIVARDGQLIHEPLAIERTIYARHAGDAVCVWVKLYDHALDRSEIANVDDSELAAFDVHDQGARSHLFDNIGPR